MSKQKNSPMKRILLIFFYEGSSVKTNLFITMTSGSIYEEHSTRIGTNFTESIACIQNFNVQINKGLLNMCSVYVRSACIE